MQKHSKIISDIKELLSLLRKYEFDNIMELYPLDNIVGRHVQNLVFSIDNLVLRVSSSGLKPYPRVSKFSIILKTNYRLQAELIDNTDIFTDYSLEIFIKGYKDVTEDSDEYKFFCWHLDKEENTDGKFMHPLYHFHAGGKDIKDFLYEEGGVVIISSPRIPHPPMDIILAIHFIIQNFVNSSEYPQKLKLLQDDNYVDIIERAQERILKPYFNVMAGSESPSYTKHNLFPLYL